MLHYYAKKSFNEDPQRVAEAPSERAWVYGTRVTDGELKQVTEKYELDPGIVKDVHDKNELPRVEYSKGSAYVFVRAPHQSTRGSVVTVPFLSVLKGSVLITLSSKEYIHPEELFRETKVDMKSTKHVFLQLVGQVINQYEASIHATGAYILNTKQRLRTHEVTNNDFIKFVSVEHDINEYRTNLTALEALLKRLAENRHDLFVAKDCELIDDMILHVNQLLVATTSHLSTVDSIRNAYTTMSNNTLNRRMKTLTLITLFIALPNVLFGMYGMNVALPYADESWAYAAIALTSLTVVLLGALIVKRARF